MAFGPLGRAHRSRRFAVNREVAVIPANFIHLRINPRTAICQILTTVERCSRACTTGVLPDRLCWQVKRTDSRIAANAAIIIVRFMLIYVSFRFVLFQIGSFPRHSGKRRLAASADDGRRWNVAPTVSGRPGARCSKLAARARVPLPHRRQPAWGSVCWRGGDPSIRRAGKRIPKFVRRGKAVLREIWFWGITAGAQRLT